MTATPILETLAYEFSVSADHVRNALEMLDAGLSAPFIGRFRRMQVNVLSESTIRRLARRRQELEELDRRRGTILRLLEKEPHVGEVHLAAIRACMDRFDLEDLFIPHRRPEPEVQLALDRGLGVLADMLVAPIPKAERPQGEGHGENGATDGDDPDEKDDDADESEAVHTHAKSANGGETQHSRAPDAMVAGTGGASAAPIAHLAASAEGALDAEPYSAVEAAPAEAPVDTPADSTGVGGTSAEIDASSDEDEEEKVAAPTLDAPAPSHAHVDLRTAMNAQLARLCSEFVRPDKGLHTESEALAGALRILSDRLGRNARLRGTVRNLMRKHGVLTVRPTVDESRLGRHKSLLRIQQPLRQIQGHRLLSIRQGQKERVVNTVIALDPGRVFPKVRAALGKHTHPAHKEVLDEVAMQALQYRLLPMVEQDVRLELKERGDQEALRFLSQHLRQILLTPPLARQPVAGIDVNAKGDWTVVIVDVDGNPVGPETRIELRSQTRIETPVEAKAELPAEPKVEASSANAGEPSADAKVEPSPEPKPELKVEPKPEPKPATRIVTTEKTLEQLGAELVAAIGPARVRHLAVGHGKGPRAAATKIRAALRAVRADGWVFLVNEAGLSSYANSELARHELPDRPVPARMAISLGRRLQDPLNEILKVDPRHLGLGIEQGLVSKANAKRVFVETIESCTAHCGCDVNHAPLSFLQHLPGLDRDTAKKITARRLERPFASREELRSEGVLTEAQWTSTAAFLRVYDSSEPLDASNLHPEQYPLARRVLESAGTSIEQSFGRPGATKGLRRIDFDLDEFTWRDLMREISFPGRDPRPRLFGPTLLDPDTDPVRLTKDRVVEGLVSNVTSFGAFVDIGLTQDAMVHISEISERYVRDARELLSVGQVVRARIVDASGQRLALSLKNVPMPVREGDGGDRRGPRRGRGRFGPGEGGERPADTGERPVGAGERPAGGDRAGGGDRRGRGRDGDRGRGRGRGPREDQQAANVRAAQTRRDGLGTRSSGGGRGGGGGRRPDGMGGPGGGRGRGDFGERGDREDFVRMAELSPKNKPANKPFASFFKGGKKEEEADKGT